MGAKKGPNSFRTLRTWDGSQHRAFEELCFQLLREPEDLPPEGGQPIRTGNPDGGVEWYIERPDGSQWGWQAKYIFETDALLGAMTKTVVRVVSERKRLCRLTFCIPTNLSTGHVKPQAKSARQKYHEKIDKWKTTIPGADQIEFCLVQESNLLERLTNPKHAGRRLFWWNEQYLGSERLADLYRQQAVVAGDRYHPDLHVDLNISEDLEALGFSERYFQHLTGFVKPINEALRYATVPPERCGPEITAAFAEAFGACRRVLENLQPEGGFQSSSADPLSQLEDSARQAESCLRRASSLCYSPVNDRGEQKSRLRQEQYQVRRLLEPIESLLDFLRGSGSRALRQRAYFLSGVAGIGKTHLLLDSTKKALLEGRPSAVFFGVQFGEGSVWQNLAQGFGLPASLGSDELLGLLDAHAEAASPSGGRFVLAVDALNDTRPAGFWSRHLPVLRAAVLQWPHLALAVSCRDAYLDTIDPENRRTSEFYLREHPGFGGNEIDATHAYFNHYGLEEPRLPLLLPEFTVPLFLQFYCESLRIAGLVAAPDHHESSVKMFERFRDAKVKKVTRSLCPSAMPLEAEEIRDQVQRIMSLLLKEMVRTGRDNVPEEQLRVLIGQSDQSVQLPPVRIIDALISEGLLVREPNRWADKKHDLIRVTFQAFSDYLIVSERLGGIDRAGLLGDEQLRSWLAAASPGILEAAAVILPDRFDIELLDYLQPSLKKQEAVEAQLSLNRRRRLERMFFNALPFRAADHISDRTIELLNECLRSGSVESARLFDVLFMLAPQPRHRLNAERLHTNLMRLKLPERDSWFGFSTYRCFNDGGSSAKRLARWASNGPYADYSPETVELACIPLVWLLSTPNRFMRDWLTKVLVQVLRGHWTALLRLLERFIHVDDPYVIERLMTVAYGCVLRTPRHRVAECLPVAQFILDAFFADVRGFAPNALTLDAARGVIEFAVAQGLLPPESLKTARPPYGFSAPTRALRDESIRKRFHIDDQYEPETSYMPIYLSVLSGGDFGHYVVESRIENFSQVPLSQPPPRPEEPRSLTRVNKRKLSRFLRSLTSSQRSALESHGSEFGVINEWSIFSSDLRLTKSQQSLFEAAFSRRRARPFRNHYSGDRARRWVFQRTISLGWKPELFGRFDNRLPVPLSRDAHKVERFGKKYQWMAFHELLARVADNYYMRGYHDEARSFDGIYEVSERDIDPSLAPVPFDWLFQEEDHEPNQPLSSTCPTKTVTIINFPYRPPEFGRFRSEPEIFLNNADSLPFADRTCRLADQRGDRWIVLDASGVFRECGKKEEDREGETLEESWNIKSWVVDEGGSKNAIERLHTEMEHLHVSELVDSQGHVNCCYLGELDWRQTRCYHHHLDPIVIDGPSGVRLPFHLSVQDYAWEGVGFDCSINETVGFAAPSSFLMAAGNLAWSGTEPSWFSGPKLAATFVACGERHSALLVREDWLTRVLQANKAVLVVAGYGERRETVGGVRYRRPWLEYGSVVLIDQGAKLNHAWRSTSKQFPAGADPYQP